MAQNLRVVVPFGAGGVFDKAPRAFGDRFARSLNETPEYVNVTGGEGVDGAEQVAKAPADGATILVGNKGALTSHPHTAPSGFQPSDFAAIGLIAEAPLAVAVGAKSPYRNLRELVEAARHNSAAITYATPHPKHTQHLAISDFAARTGIAFTFVLAEGGNPGAIRQIIDGEIAFAFLAAHNYVEPLKQGTIRVLGVAAAERLPFLPNEATFKEQGFDLISAIWLGLLCKASVPQPRLAALRKAFGEAARDADTRASIEKLYLVPTELDHVGFAARIASDFELHGRVLKRMGIIS